MTRDSRRRRRNERENQPSPRIYQKKPPFWKAIIIQLLRGISGFLESAAVQLETGRPETDEGKQGFWSGLARKWERFLNQVRLFLPSSVSNNLSDTVLTGILAVLALGMVWTGGSFLAGKPAEVVSVKPVEDVSTPQVTVTPEAPVVEVTPNPEEVVTVLPEPTPTPEAEVKPIPTPLPELTPTPEVEEVKPVPTPEPEVTPEPEPEVTPTPEPESEVIPAPTPEAISTPEPVIELTPEQALIAAIQNQVGKVSNDISLNLIKSVEANFRTSDLTIRVNDAWYILEKSQQNQLAQEILQRSRQLDFLHLEIVDSQNQLIARSPVVGDKIIILK